MTPFINTNEYVGVCLRGVWSKSSISHETVLWKRISMSNESKQFTNA